MKKNEVLFVVHAITLFVLFGLAIIFVLWIGKQVLG